jgi:hypothetical protein
MRYIVYDTSTGQILRTGICDKDQLANQAGRGETAVEGTADDRLQKFEKGRLRGKTPAELEAEQRPPCPEEDKLQLIPRKLWWATLLRIRQLEDRVDALEGARP